MNNIGEFKLCEYLGDSVYIGLNSYNQLYIFTYNGTEESLRNKICLESDTLANFLLAIRKFGFKVMR